MKYKGSTQFEELRKRAKAILENREQPVGDTPRQDITELINEIQVYQVELEIQNEELRNTQKELERSRDRLSLLYHQAPVGYVVMDRSGIIVNANHTFSEMLRQPRSRLLNKPFSQFLDPDDRTIFFSRFNAFFKHPGGKSLQVRMVPARGSCIDARLEGRSLHAEERPGERQDDELFLIVADITEQKHAEAQRRRLEDQLRQAQKLEAVGTLAGGVAHNFNNILGVILGNAELALEDMPQWKPAYGNLKEILRASFRARDMIKELLSFSRKSVEERMVLNISSLVKGSLKVLEPTLSGKIRLEIKIGKELGLIHAAPAQITQVLTNLTANATDAMAATGGSLSVNLENVDVPDGNDLNLPAGPYVRLCIADTGDGIPEEIRDRVFEPYFTTKEVGKGSGLGLSAVHGIVKQHGGAVRMESRPGQGSRFDVFFPVVDGASAMQDQID